MYTLIDYIKLYKKIEIDEVCWNDIDNLICSLLTYLPIKSFNKEKNIKSFYEYACSNSANDKNSIMISTAQQILNLISDSNRYKDLFVSNFVNVRNNNIQFGAVTFRIKNKIIISYKGTDDSIAGWIENFRILYKYPTNTQLEAINYFNKIVNNINCEELYIVGHSKGGNLAMVSAMESSQQNFDKITKIYNFDGPGFRKEEFETQKCIKMYKKVVSILPTGAIVGMMLNNSNNIYVKSCNRAFKEHYPMSWYIFKENFVTGELSNESLNFHNSILNALNNAENNKIMESFEKIFEIVQKKYSSKDDVSLEDLLKAYIKIRKDNKEVSKYVDAVFSALIKFYIKGKYL